MKKTANFVTVENKIHFFYSKGCLIFTRFYIHFQSYSHVPNKSASTLISTVEKFPTGTLIQYKEI